MECPYCHKPTTIVTNSRTTKINTQIWRRRKCLSCKSIFTTHESIDLSHILIMKKTGKAQIFSSIKLYSGIFHASTITKIPHREMFIQKISREIEAKILSLKKEKFTSDEIADIVLHTLRKRHIPTFIRFLIFCKELTTEKQLKQAFVKYLN